MVEAQYQSRWNRVESISEELEQSARAASSVASKWVARRSFELVSRRSRTQIRIRLSMTGRVSPRSAPLSYTTLCGCDGVYKDKDTAG